MNRELEALIMAREAWQESTGEVAGQRRSIYQSRLEDFISGHPRTDRAALESFVRAAHLRWIHRQRKPAALPAKA